MKFVPLFSIVLIGFAALPSGAQTPLPSNAPTNLSPSEKEALKERAAASPKPHVLPGKTTVHRVWLQDKYMTGNKTPTQGESSAGVNSLGQNNPDSMAVVGASLQAIMPHAIAHHRAAALLLGGAQLPKFGLSSSRTTASLTDSNIPERHAFGAPTKPMAKLLATSTIATAANSQSTMGTLSATMVSLKRRTSMRGAIKRGVSSALFGGGLIGETGNNVMLHHGGPLSMGLRLKTHKGTTTGTH